MSSTVIPSQGTSTQDGLSLQDVVLRHRPGTVTDIRSAGKESVLCFFGGSEELFLALDHDLARKSVENVLVSIANMLACCHHCTNRGLRSILCRSEYRLTSRRLREFLGAAGYQEFVANAPISAVKHEGFTRRATMNVHQHLKVGESQGVTVIRFLDRRLVDGIDLIELWQALFQMLETEGWKKVVLDLSLVDFLGSAALGKLVALHKKVAANDGVLKLCCLCPDALQVFLATKLDGLFDIEKTESEAIVAFAEDDLKMESNRV